MTIFKNNLMPGQFWLGVSFSEKKATFKNLLLWRLSGQAGIYEKPNVTSIYSA